MSNNAQNIIDQQSANQAVADRPTDPNTTYGVISRNDNTENHGAQLREQGYEVVATEDSFAVKGTFLRAGKNDVIHIDTLPKAVAFFRGVVANKRLLNYNQRFLLPGKKKPLFRGPILGYLGQKALQDALGFNPTCLIAKKGKVQTVEAVKKAPKDIWATPTAPTPAPTTDVFAAQPAPVSDPFAVAPSADPFAA
jgi:hypothetical protein